MLLTTDEILNELCSSCIFDAKHCHKAGKCSHYDRFSRKLDKRLGEKVDD